MALLPLADALAMLVDGAGPAATEAVPLAEAAGRVLAARLRARRTQPPFDAAAMDGYAVRAVDVARLPARLRVIGSAPAGRRFDGMVQPGETVRIFTGAPMPEGADAIVIQENAGVLGTLEIEVFETVSTGRHIRRRGLDFSAGDVLLEAGRVLDAGALALAASANHASLDVVVKPLVAILATGDELLPPGSEPGPDQIIASNGYGVAAIAQAAGARVLDLGIAPDRPEAILTKLRVAQDANADVVVTLGGASVGDHDLVHAALRQLGVTIDFWKIAMRPGKPLMFGRKGATRFLGLPGNPVASLVCSHIFLRPLLARLLGTIYAPDVRQAVLGAPLAANDLRQDYIRTRLAKKDGALIATPFSVQDSSMLRFFAEAGGLIVRAPHAAAQDAGSAVDVLMTR